MSLFLLVATFGPIGLLRRYINAPATRCREPRKAPSVTSKPSRSHATHESSLNSIVDIASAKAGSSRLEVYLDVSGLVTDPYFQHQGQAKAFARTSSGVNSITRLQSGFGQVNFRSDSGAIAGGIGLALQNLSRSTIRFPTVWLKSIPIRPPGYGMLFLNGMGTAFLCIK